MPWVLPSALRKISGALAYVPTRIVVGGPGGPAPPRPGEQHDDEGEERRPAGAIHAPRGYQNPFT
jgi:hypothetical protein